MPLDTMQRERSSETQGDDVSRPSTGACPLSFGILSSGNRLVAARGCWHRGSGSGLSLPRPDMCRTRVRICPEYATISSAVLATHEALRSPHLARSRPTPPFGGSVIRPSAPCTSTPASHLAARVALSRSDGRSVRSQTIFCIVFGFRPAEVAPSTTRQQPLLEVHRAHATQQDPSACILPRELSAASSLRTEAG